MAANKIGSAPRRGRNRTSSHIEIGSAAKRRAGPLIDSASDTRYLDAVRVTSRQVWEHSALAWECSQESDLCPQHLIDIPLICGNFSGFLGNIPTHSRIIPKNQTQSGIFVGTTCQSHGNIPRKTGFVPKQEKPSISQHFRAKVSAVAFLF